MNRIPLIIGNWKMYKTSSEAKAFIAALGKQETGGKRRIALAVPFTALESAVLAAQGLGISIGAQNMHDREEGAFTGEISARMLKESGASFVLLGHSERRQYFGEDNLFIHRKLLRALQEGITPILCIGELAAERESGEYPKVLMGQLNACLQDVSVNQATDVVIAYEPVWAIGTGKMATPEMAQEVHALIRTWLEERFGKESAAKISLLYGGSVKSDTMPSLMQRPDIDGVLVGGASLEAASFAQIVNYSGGC